MSSIRSWIRRHRRAIIVSAGLIGVGYVCYRTIKTHYNASKEKETQAYLLRQAKQHVEAQLQLHFQSVQRISDTTTLPCVMPQLRSQLLDHLNLSALTEKLVQGKEVPRGLSGKEKIELWQEVKILSFTLAVTSMWALVLLVLFIRIQLNVLARHLYINTARDISITDLKDCAKGISRDIQQKYVALAEFFPNKGLEVLIADIKMAVEHVLASKPLREPCSLLDLKDIFVQIANVFEKGKSKWITYMLPSNSAHPDEINNVNPDEVSAANTVKVLSNLVDETRDILESVEFQEVLTASFSLLLDLVVEDFREIFKGGDVDAIPFAKLFPPVSTIEALLLDQSSENQFIQQLTNLPEFQTFVATVYSAAN